MNAKAHSISTAAAQSRFSQPKPVPARPYAPRRFTAVTRQRFNLNRWRALVEHLGREPTYPERIIIDRVISIEWDLRRMDAKLTAGEELSGHALRARLAAENRLRLDLTALGLKQAPNATKPPSIAEIIAEEARANNAPAPTEKGSPA